MRRALAIDEKSYGPDHPNVAIRLNNLAMLLQDTNRLAEAEPLMRRALAIDETELRPRSSRRGDRPQQSRALLQDTNRLAEAEPLMRRALRSTKELRPDHPNVAIRLNNLAALLQDTNRLAEAEPLMRRALAIDESSRHVPQRPAQDRPPEPLAIDERSNQSSLDNLRCFRTRTASPRPSRLMRRALAIDEKSYGPDHPKVAIRLNNLAELLRPRTASPRPSR